MALNLPRYHGPECVGHDFPCPCAYPELDRLLKLAHDKMDDYNARHNPERTVPDCTWCLSEGYDANGLKHKDDCVLIQIRKVLT